MSHAVVAFGMAGCAANASDSCSLPFTPASQHCYTFLQEMNPQTPSSKCVLGNPFACAAFKSIEPYLLEYMLLDLKGLAKATGFICTSEVDSSPSHKTFFCLQSKMLAAR